MEQIPFKVHPLDSAHYLFINDYMNAIKTGNYENAIYILNNIYSFLKPLLKKETIESIEEREIYKGKKLKDVYVLALSEFRALKEKKPTSFFWTSLYLSIMGNLIPVLISALKTKKKIREVDITFKGIEIKEEEIKEE